MTNYYHLMLGLPEAMTEPNHYELLGLELFEPDLERISAAAVDRIQLLNSEWENAEKDVFNKAQELSDQVTVARDTLSDATEKAAYDVRLRRELGLESPPSFFGNGIAVHPLVAEVGAWFPVPNRLG